MMRRLRKNRPPKSATGIFSHCADERIGAPIAVALNIPIASLTPVATIVSSGALQSTDEVGAFKRSWVEIVYQRVEERLVEYGFLDLF